MSARRKGKPQQRIHLDSVEADNDLLTCGKCQQEFYLCDINSFIKHKISLCSKSPLHCHPNSSPRNHGDPDTDQSLPTTPVKSVDGGDETSVYQKEKALLSTFNFQALFSNKDSLEKIIREELGRTNNDSSGHLHKKKDIGNKVLVDAETITVYSEPSLFTCSTCKSVYSSSWFLLQHVQKSHGLAIYVDTENGTERVNGRAADLVVSLDRNETDDSAKSPSNKPPTDSRQTVSPVISKSELFCQPTPPFLPSSQRTAVAAQLSTTPWKTFNRPAQSATGSSSSSAELAMLHPDFMGRLAAGLQFRPGDITLQDIYSQRLRQLAGGQPNNNPPSSTSSNSSPPPPALSSPITKKPPSLGGGSSVAPGDAPSAFSTPSSKKTKTEAAASQQEDKGYTCSICSKQFRFGVTLNAHHRSHTGEKPFKCPFCANSFPLASRLKRHLVNEHKFSTLANLDGHTRSRTPDSREEEEASDDEMDPPDTQEFALQETQAEAELIMASRHDLGSSQSIEASMRENTYSVLSEVMKGSGMDKIPQYKEAFQAALDEMSDNDDRSEESNSVNQEPMDSASEMTESNSLKEESRDSMTTPNNRRPSSQSRDSSPAPPPAKLIKIEPQLEDMKALPASLYNNLDALYPREIRDAATMAAVAQVGMYPSIWFQPSRDFLPFSSRGGGPIFSSTPAATRENGLATTQSALKVSSQTTSKSASEGGNSTTGGSASSKSPTNAALSGQQVSLRRRNDTCEYCGKIFKNCSNLTVHRRSHTGEKPYKCQLCSYACAQSSKLTRHMRTHGRMGKDVYKCKFCEMPFSVPSTLEKHMRKCMENHPGLSSGNLSPVSLNLSKSLEGAHTSPGNNSVSLLGNLSLSKALDINVTGSSLAFTKDMKSAGDAEDGLPNYNGLDLSKPLDIGLMSKADMAEEMSAYNGLNLSKSLSSVAILGINPTEADKSDSVPYNGLDLSKAMDTSLMAGGRGDNTDSGKSVEGDASSDKVGESDSINERNAYTSEEVTAASHGLDLSKDGGRGGSPATSDNGSVASSMGNQGSVENEDEDSQENGELIIVANDEIQNSENSNN